MEALIRGTGRSRNFSKKISCFSDLGCNVMRERLIKHFLLVCYREELSGADLVVGSDVIVRYNRPPGMPYKVAQRSADHTVLPDRAAACPA